DVVPLVRDREPDQVELGEGALGLERERAAAYPLILRKVLGIGQEHSLADNVGEGVQMSVDGLEPEVRHPDGVGVRIDESERDAATPVLPDGARLLSEEAIGFRL